MWNNRNTCGSKKKGVYILQHSNFLPASTESNYYIVEESAIPDNFENKVLFY